MAVGYIIIMNCQMEKMVTKEIGGSSVMLGIPDDDHSGKIRFSFNDAGEIVKDESSDRYNRIDGTFQEVGSIGYRSNYKKIDGIKVPMKFTIVRVLPNGIHEEFW